MPLSAMQQRALPLLAAGQSLRDVARAIGATHAAVHRWHGIVAFAEALELARAKLAGARDQALLDVARQDLRPLNPADHGGSLDAMRRAHEVMTSQLILVSSELLNKQDYRTWLELYTRLSDRTGHAPPTGKSDGAPAPKPWTPEQVERMSRQLLEKINPPTQVIEVRDASEAEPAAAVERGSAAPSQQSGAEDTD